MNISSQLIGLSHFPYMVLELISQPFASFFLWSNQTLFFFHLIYTMVHMVTIKLTPTNYLLWRRQFVPLLDSEDLMGYLDGSFSTHVAQVCAKNDLVPNPAYKKWHTQDRILLNLLYASLTEECMVEVFNCTTARDAWLALEVSFSHSSKTRELQLKDELQLM